MSTTLAPAVGGRVADLRARRAARRVLRARRDRLRAELASYSTPAQRAELEAMLRAAHRRGGRAAQRHAALSPAATSGDAW